MNIYLNTSNLTPNETRIIQGHFFHEAINNILILSIASDTGISDLLQALTFDNRTLVIKNNNMDLIANYELN